MHSHVSTTGKTVLDRKEIRDEVRNIIHTQLVSFESDARLKTILNYRVKT
jgi:1-acyl-sn-glycerol-3-phosphate acyltransferase